MSGRCKYFCPRCGIRGAGYDGHGTPHQCDGELCEYDRTREGRIIENDGVIEYE